MTNISLPGIKQFDLTGKLAIITGGSKGLGFAMASGLASAGANIMLVNRNEAQGKEAASIIEETYQRKVLSFSGDVTDEEKMEWMAETAIATYGSIDILINNAGINIRGPIDELSEKDFQQVLQVNVTGTWLPSKAVVPYMKQANEGKIINIASTLGLVGLANRTPYTASKGAVVQMTRALALELAPHNIQVNAICPGPFLTEMNIPIADTEEARQFIIGATALGRWGELKEIQGPAILLASEASDYMVGSMLTVDGGWTAK